MNYTKVKKVKVNHANSSITSSPLNFNKTMLQIKNNCVNRFVGLNKMLKSIITKNILV